ncbi:MAG: carboxypeptidase-like regulatory domain-containing protein, partial [Bacteroidales bacterium]
RMLLQGFLKGEVEEAQYYFSNPYDSVAGALNLVMLTHGWRGFLRKDKPVDTENGRQEGQSPGETELSMQPEEGFRVSGRISDMFNKPIPDLKISLLAQGDHTFVQDIRSDEKGRFAFIDLPLRGTTKVTLYSHSSRITSKIKRLNVGFELDPQQKLQKPKVYAPRLPEQSIGVMALLDAFRKQKLLEQTFLDSLRNISGMQYIEEVSITRKPLIKNSYNRNGPGNADLVLDEKAMGKFDRFSNLLEVLEHEVPSFRKGYFSSGPSYFFSLEPREGYDPRFAIGIRRIIFRVDGAPLPYYGEVSVTPQGKEDYFEYQANLLRSIPVSQLVGVEVMVSLKYLAGYGELSMDDNSLVAAFAREKLYNINRENCCFIEITTKEGKGIVRGERGGKITTYIRGVATPRQFYVPKYTPTEFPDRLPYHRKPTLLWVPELITSEEGKAEVSLPVGRNFARTLRVRVESYSPTGMVGSDEVYLPVGREKGTW